MRTIKRIIIKTFSTTYFQPFFEIMHYVALKGLNYGSANSPEDSGEKAVITMLKHQLPQNPVLFDVGANNGQYLSLLLDILKDMNPIVHSFEPDKKAYQKLVDKFSKVENVILNNFALGETESTALLYVSKEGGVDSSLIDVGDKKLQEHEIKVTTLDCYCSEKKIDNIHFLKIDTEGFELNVLKGAEKAIRNNKIQAVQLEHGSIHSIMAGASLFQYRKILSNFSMFHIKQNGIYKLKYSTKNEIFYNSNYYFKLK